MNSTARRQLVDNIHAAPGKCVLAVTGGGIAVMTDLFLVPGASRTVLEVTVPYGGQALGELLGTTATSAVTLATSEAMARACYQRAIRFADDPAESLFGIACTAALVTDRERRGEDRACIAAHDGTTTRSFELSLDKRRPDDDGQARIEQDRAVADEILVTIARAFGVPPVDGSANGPAR
ncbi:MAG: hypothetical protein AAF493_24155 [Pseudomonadota bacterium]